MGRSRRGTDLLRGFPCRAPRTRAHGDLNTRPRLRSPGDKDLLTRHDYGLRAIERVRAPSRPGPAASETPTPAQGVRPWWGVLGVRRGDKHAQTHESGRDRSTGDSRRGGYECLAGGRRSALVDTVLAVNADSAEDEELAIDLLRDRGAQMIERADGAWHDGKWVDFDPVRPPDIIESRVGTAHAGNGARP